MVYIRAWDVVRNAGGYTVPTGCLSVDRQPAEQDELLLEIEEEVPQIFVACLNKSLSLQAFQMTRKFRDAGIRAEMDHQGRSLKAQFKYADKLGTKFIAILADDELARGVLKLRDMATKEEWEVPLDSASEALKERL